MVTVRDVRVLFWFLVISILTVPVPAQAELSSALDVASVPRGAAVSLDGEPVGRTPASLTGLTPGLHRLEISSRGYRTETRWIRLRAGRTEQVSVTLARQEGTVRFRSPHPAEIRIDGRWTEAGTHSVSPGSYQFEVRAFGMRPATVPVTVRDGETIEVPLSLHPASPMVRVLSVSRGAGGSVAVSLEATGPATARLQLVEDGEPSGAIVSAELTTWRTTVVVPGTVHDGGPSGVEIAITADGVRHRERRTLPPLRRVPSLTGALDGLPAVLVPLPRVPTFVVAGGAAAGPDLRDGRVPLAMAAAGPLATHLSGAVVATLTATAGDAPRTRVGATITAGPWGRSERLTPVFQLSGATSLPDPSAPTAVATAAVDTAIAGGAGRFGLRLSVAGVGLQTDSVTVEPEAGAALGWGSERRGELSASVIGRDGAYAGWRLASGVQWSPVGSGVYVALAAGLEGDDAGVLKGWGVLGIGVSGAGNGR